MNYHTAVTSLTSAGVLVSIHGDVGKRDIYRLAGRLRRKLWRPVTVTDYARLLVSCNPEEATTVRAELTCEL